MSCRTRTLFGSTINSLSSSSEAPIRIPRMTDLYGRRWRRLRLQSSVSGTDFLLEIELDDLLATFRNTVVRSSSILITVCDIVPSKPFSQAPVTDYLHIAIPPHVFAKAFSKQHIFPTTALSCGAWEYRGLDPVFVPYFALAGKLNILYLPEFRLRLYIDVLEFLAFTGDPIVPISRSALPAQSTLLPICYLTLYGLRRTHSHDRILLELDLAFRSPKRLTLLNPAARSCR